MTLTFGPLRYRLAATDDGSAEGLVRLAADCSSLSAGRDIFCDCTLAEIHLEDEEVTGRPANGAMPQRLLGLLPGEAPRDGWEVALEPLKQVTFWHPTARLCLTVVEPTIGPVAANGYDSVRFRLPWYALFRDVLSLGGCIVHGGLAERPGCGCLIVGAAGSGKSTAMGRLGATWRVLSDDAALVWPEGDGWYASPLPTWSYILGEEASRPDLVPWKTQERVRLDRLYFLEQGDKDVIRRVGAAQAVRPLYLAAAEYPAVFSLRHRFRRELFAFAAALARAVPAGVLELTLTGEFWRLVEDDCAS